MTSETIQIESVLAIEIGTTNTRALLFDVVEHSYRLLAAGTAPTTMTAPFQDASEGVREAVNQITNITGRSFFNVGETIVVPTGTDGVGVDAVVVTLSAGVPIRVLLMGLLEDISLESARNLAGSIYTQVVDSISMNDRRGLEKGLDDFLRQRPELVLITGGTENGASKSVLRLLELVGLSCYLLPENQRPLVVFAGNSAVASDVQESLREFTPTRVAANVRPTLETEQLEPAQAVLREVFRDFHGKAQQGVKEVDAWASGRLMPASLGTGRVVRFISKYYESQKGVLSVDVGSGNTTIASAYKGELQLDVITRLGLGQSLPRLLNYTQVSQIAQWLPFEMSAVAVRDFVYHKAEYPNSIPMTVEELLLEQALARELIRVAMAAVRPRFSPATPRIGPLPSFEPILASGSVLTQAPKLGQTMLTLLDALEPCGITTVILDKHHILALLGAVAEINPEMTVQVLDSPAMINLGTVIAPVSRAKFGTPVLSVRMKKESGEEERIDVKQGSIEVIPLAYGKTTQMHLRPLHRADIGMGGPGQGGSLKVPGGVLGLVIDARGRPMQLPTDEGRRRELQRKWLWTLGGN